MGLRVSTVISTLTGDINSDKSGYLKFKTSYKVPWVGLESSLG